MRTSTTRSTSKAIFGNDNFLTVLRFVHTQRGTPTYVRQIASVTGLPDPVVRPIVQRLLRAGAIEAAGRRERTILYKCVRAHPLWGFAAKLRED